MEHSVDSENSKYLSIVNELKNLNREQLARLNSFMQRYKMVVLDISPNFKRLLALEYILIGRIEDRGIKREKEYESYKEELIRIEGYIIEDLKKLEEMLSNKLFDRSILDYEYVLKIPYSKLQLIDESNISGADIKLNKLFAPFISETAKLQKVVNLFGTDEVRIKYVLKLMNDLHEEQLISVKKLIELMQGYQEIKIDEKTPEEFVEKLRRNIETLESLFREEKEEVFDVLSPLMNVEQKLVDKIQNLFVKIEHSDLSSIVQEYLKIIRQCSSPLEVKKINDKARDLIAANTSKLSPAFIAGFSRAIHLTSLQNNAVIEQEHSATKYGRTDELTRAYDRRAFIVTLNNWIKDVNSKQGQGGIEQTIMPTFYICMFDIDFFKSFNDLYGHNIGDEVLGKVVEIFHEDVRHLDKKMFFRIGGEEFAFLLKLDENGNSSRIVYDKMDFIRKDILEKTLERCREINKEKFKKNSEELYSFISKHRSDKMIEILIELKVFLSKDFSSLTVSDFTKKRNEISSNLYSEIKEQEHDHDLEKVNETGKKFCKLFEDTVEIKRRYDFKESITISCGIFEYKIGMSLDDLYKAVDQKLYDAKHTGRNKVVI